MIFPSHMLSRSPVPIGAVVVAVVAMSLVAAPGAYGDLVTRTNSGYSGGPALAADGRVAVGEQYGDGELRVFAFNSRSRTFSQLAHFASLADRDSYPVLTLTGSGGILTARYDVFARVRAGDGEQAVATLLSSRTMTLLPWTAPLASCAAPGRAFSPDAAGGSDFVASVGEDCATRSAVTLRTLHTTRIVPAANAPGGSVEVGELRATGEFVAWIETLSTPAAAPRRTLVIARGATGQVLSRTALDSFPYQIGLGADATVALNTLADIDCGLRVFGLAATAPRRLQLPRGLCPHVSFGALTLALSGARIAYRTLTAHGTGLTVTDPAGAAHPLGEARLSAQPSPIAFDGRTVFVVRPDRQGDALLAIDADATAPPARQPSCSVHRSGSGPLPIARDKTIRVSLRCPAGCRGTLRLVQRHGRRERVLGERAFVSARQRFAVHPPIARYATALAGCRRGIRVNAVLFTHTGTRSSLGTYRLISRTPCRRSTDPPFTAPLPAPRP
jgi:hypothetical protein